MKIKKKKLEKEIIIKNNHKKKVHFYSQNSLII